MLRRLSVTAATMSDGGGGGTVNHSFLHSKNLSLLPDVPRCFILAVRGLEPFLTKGVPDEEVRGMVAETLPPATLFDPELVQLATIYRNFRNWINCHGGDLVQLASRRIILILDETLYADPEDQEMAKELAKQLLQTRNRRGSAGIPPRGDGTSVGASGGSSGSSGQPSAASLAHNIGMRFKDKDSKFSGQPHEALHDYVICYQQVTRNYYLDNDQKLQLQHNLFGGDAKRLYNDNVEGRCATFSEAIALVGNQYNSPMRQTGVQNRLYELKLSQFTAQGQTDELALASVHQTVAKLAPQPPLTHLGDAQKVEFLRGAVVGAPWAIEPINRIATQGLTYQALYAELLSALNLHLETRAANFRNGPQLGQAAATTPCSLHSSINYEGQGMYAHPSKGIGEW